ncbi:hypothetical protein AGMMS49975_16880 [Clostridia bacterium]|nr:hypothetical protein AGMMS49975_16880 [Clostridia bacterium]
MDYFEGELEQAKDFALKLLSLRDRTEREIRERLYEKGYSDEITERVLEILGEYNYIDDENFAKKYVSDCFRLKGWGNLKILHMLREKGVSNETGENAVSEYLSENDIYPVIEKYLIRRGDSQKTVNYLINKGFLYDDIENALYTYKETL